MFTSQPPSAALTESLPLRARQQFPSNHGSQPRVPAQETRGAPAERDGGVVVVGGAGAQKTNQHRPHL